MKKIGFVVPWFGWDIPGGAEAELRELVLHLRETSINLEILTTCAKAFNSDWSQNYYKQGVYIENNITIKRFAVDKRNGEVFDKINAKLMKGMVISKAEQDIFIKEMINSSNLYDYMKEYDEEYSLFVFIPYMFGTTYYGVQINPSKSVLIPCFHDESYFYMDIFRDAYSKVAGIIYNAKPEKELVEKNYNVNGISQIVMGIGMDTNISGNAQRFRDKYKINSPFILYAGRKDFGKNVDTLVRYFGAYLKRNKMELQLVLIGGGNIKIPFNIKDQVRDLGYVNTQDKYDAYAAAEFLCQPSKHESFSLVIMESWLCGQPVLIHGDCAVTRSFVRESNGGLYFCNYFEFEECVNYFLNNKDVSDEMGKLGREYVKRSFSWNVIVEKYLQFFNALLV